MRRVGRSEISKKYILRVGENWEQLFSADGESLAESHRLGSADILEALGVSFTVEEIEEED